jgi:acetyl esterase/lipase
MITIETGIAYGEGQRRRLDLYSPHAGNAPIVVYLYGGSWQSGRREIYRFLGKSLARAGFLAVVADYPVYPQARFPGFLTDAAALLRFVRAEAGSWGGDKDCLFLIGHSAGAHTAALLAFDAERYRVPPLKGVVAVAGPLTFNPLEHDSVRAVFEGFTPIDDARPIKRVHGRAPPFLLLHGTADTTVAPANSQNLAAAIRAAGGTAELKLYPGLGHVGIIAATSWPMRWRAPVFRDIVRFLTDHAGSGAERPVN